MSKRVRMLVDVTVEGLRYKANQVVEFPDALAAPLLASDPSLNLSPQADASPAAVKYCLEHEGAEPILHEDAAAREAKNAVAVTQRVLDDAEAAVDAETDAGRRAELKKSAIAAAGALREAKANAKAVA